MGEPADPAGGLDPLWRRLGERLAALDAEVTERPIAPKVDADALRTALGRHDFSTPIDPGALLDEVCAGLRDGQVHATHPRYFGLVHPAPIAAAIVADALVAAFDTQLATRGHAPWAVAVEDHLVQAFGARFGYPVDAIEGTFTSGGAEANTTALLVALDHAFPQARAGGLRALGGDPVLYVSNEGHPTVARAARIAGLGADAVRVVPVDARQRMRPEALAGALKKDRRAGKLPFLIVATAGTTSTGAIDPLDELADLTARARCWLHVDAAWGGLAALVPERAGVLAGLSRADSLTFDPHKVLPIPIGAGMYLSRRPGALGRTFQPARAGYTPRDGAEAPHARSMQWSRRFSGLKVFAALAALGWDGLATMLRGQLALADRLRTSLAARGWSIVNDTPLPVVCFVDATRADGRTARLLEGVARGVIRAGAGWLSMTRLSSGAPLLRACVNNHRTEPADVDALVDALDLARAAVGPP